MSLVKLAFVISISTVTLIQSSQAYAQNLTFEEFREYLVQTFLQTPRARLRPTRDRSNRDMLKYTTGGVARDALPSIGDRPYFTGVMEAIALVEVTREDVSRNFWREWAERAEGQVRTIVQRRNSGELDEQAATRAIEEAKDQMRQEYDDQLHDYATSHGFRCGVRPCPGAATYRWERVVERGIEFAYFMPPQGAKSMGHMRAGDWNWFQFCKARGKTVVEPQWELMSLDDKGRFEFPFLGPCTIRMQIVYTDGGEGIVQRFYVPKAQVYRPSN